MSLSFGLRSLRIIVMLLLCLKLLSPFLATFSFQFISSVIIMKLALETIGIDKIMKSIDKLSNGIDLKMYNNEPML